MTDQQPTPSGNESDKEFVANLEKELREMGKQLEAAFRATIESDRAKRMQADLTAGVRELSGQLRTAVDSLQKDPRLQEVEERGRQALEQARESKFVSEVQDVLVTGIAQLNTQLRKLVERIEAESGASSGATTTQHVPIEEEPNTGETTRLDN
jgi:hypothetical protein